MRQKIIIQEGLFMPFNVAESEKLKEIEIVGATEQGSGGAGPVFYNSVLSLY